MLEKSLEKICALGLLAVAVAACLPSGGQARREAQKGGSLASAADPVADTCRWRVDEGVTHGQCVVTDEVQAAASIALTAGRPDVTTIEVRGATGGVGAENYGYDERLGALAFHATAETPKLLVPGGLLEIRYRTAAEPAPTAATPVDGCSLAVEDFGELVGEMRSIGATCAVDADCELVAAPARVCAGTHFLARSILTGERRRQLDSGLAMIEQACSEAATGACEVAHPRTAVCDRETNECVGRF